MVEAIAAGDGRIGWTVVEEGDGIRTFRLSSWAKYFDFIEAEVVESPATARHDYIWRGQRRSDWSLSSSFDRLLDKLKLMSTDPNELERLSEKHLKRFKHAARGRRGLNPPKDLEANEWWALGQHFGLATPLLDWTRSPFAAAYFAFEELASDPTKYRRIYALDQVAVEQRLRQVNEGPSIEAGRPEVVQVIESASDENPRLISQGAVFTRAPIGTPIEEWVELAFEDSGASVLLRIEIPDADRLSFLRALNRMNINHLSLFPDLTGSARFTNMELEFVPE